MITSDSTTINMIHNSRSDISISNLNIANNSDNNATAGFNMTMTDLKQAG